MPKDLSSNASNTNTSYYNGRGMRVYNAPVYHGAAPVRRPGGNARRKYLIKKSTCVLHKPSITLNMICTFQDVTGAIRWVTWQGIVVSLSYYLFCHVLSFCNFYQTPPAWYLRHRRWRRMGNSHGHSSGNSNSSGNSHSGGGAVIEGKIANTKICQSSKT